MKLVLALFMFFLVSCSAEERDIGVCKLDCGSAKIANSKAKIRLLTPPVEVSCGAVDTTGGPAAFTSPITVQFMVEQSQTTFGDTEQKLVPVEGAAFEPLVNGIMNTAVTNPDIGTPADGSNPSKFAGVVTSKSSWCTDSCGVATVQVWPVCIPTKTNKVSVQIHSGGLYPSKENVATIDVDDSE